jgi:hypothetical protein
MLMTYENGTYEEIGQRAERWTRQFLERLSKDPITITDSHDSNSNSTRRLTGHFSFDFIVSTTNDELYPIECNARVHTAIIMLPLSKIADCYTPNPDSESEGILRPKRNTLPRSWLYNDLIMRYLPILVPSPNILRILHPSLPATIVSPSKKGITRPSEDALVWRVDPTLVADDWVPFLVLWHVYWPSLLLVRWWKGQRWTRVSRMCTKRDEADDDQLNVSTGRIFEA